MRRPGIIARKFKIADCTIDGRFTWAAWMRLEANTETQIIQNRIKRYGHPYKLAA